MSFDEKERKDPVVPDDVSVGTAADVEAVMRKYDRESNTRIWDGWPKKVIRWLMELGYIPSFCTACYREGRTGS